MQHRVENRRQPRRLPPLVFPLAAQLCVERVARLLFRRALALVCGALLKQSRAAQEPDGVVGERRLR